MARLELRVLERTLHHQTLQTARTFLNGLWIDVNFWLRTKKHFTREFINSAYLL